MPNTTSSKCSCAVSTTTWTDTGRDRRGWIRTACSVCGRFFGFRPPEGTRIPLAEHTEQGSVDALS